MYEILKNQLTTEELNEKVKGIFNEVIVNKMHSQLKSISRLPRFVSEYLITKFLQGNVTQEKIEKMNEFVRNYHPERKEKERIKSILMKTGSYKLLEEFQVETDIERGTHRVLIPCLDIRNAKIFEPILYDNENLLVEGMWGMGTLAYVADSTQGSVILTEFVPFQISHFDLEQFQDDREHFTSGEWIDLLMNTLGLSPEQFSLRQKIVILSRLVPLVEPNVNFIELGPKGTGKTFLYRHVSFHSRIISGGRITPATLFVNLLTKRLGLLGYKDCVVFDEISTTEFKDAPETIGKLKDYMESGHFDRGTKQIQSDASIVLLGNIEVKDGQPTLSPYFQILPDKLNETAFLDRIHGFIPGWELARIQKSSIHLSSNLGFVSDYFAEFLHKIRELDFSGHIAERVILHDVDIRDEKAIKRILSGLLKVLFPHGNFSIEEFIICLELAIEYRQRVINQLQIMEPGEFKHRKIKFSLIGRSASINETYDQQPMDSPKERYDQASVEPPPSKDYDQPSVESIEEEIELAPISLLNALQQCPRGDRYATRYEKICESILSYLFIPPLELSTTPEPIRDTLEERGIYFLNSAEEGKWKNIGDHYGENIIAYCRNQNQAVDRSVIEQLEMRESSEKFRIICSREEPSESAEKARIETYRKSGVIIVFLSDQDMISLIKRRDNGKSPEELIMGRVERVEFQARGLLG